MSGESPALGRIVRTYAIAQVAVILLQFVLLLFGLGVGSGTNLAGSFAAAMLFGIVVIIVCGLYLGAFHVAYGPLARWFEKKNFVISRP